MKLSDKCCSLLKQQFNPREISNKLGIDINEIMKYLYIQVGKGDIKRSDILFSFEPEVRKDYEKIIKLVSEERNERIRNFTCTDGEKSDKLKKLAEKMIRNARDTFNSDELEWDDEIGLYWNTTDWQFFQTKSDEYFGPGIEPDLDLFKIYFELRKRKAWIGEMYIDLFFIENAFHMLIREVLGGKDWWKKIPPEIGDDIRKRTGIKVYSEDLYNYTNLIDLSKIIRNFWEEFSIFFPEKPSKRKFKDDFGKLNKIRNKAMHPIRDLPTLYDLFIVHQSYLNINEILKNYDELINSKL